VSFIAAKTALAELTPLAIIIIRLFSVPASADYCLITKEISTLALKDILEFLFLL
jgi:hypothetical protein